MFFHNYPYSDAHELNLDWIIRQIKSLESEMKTFVSYASIKYANPILWNITSQYEQNTVVIDPATGDGYLSVAPVPIGISLSNTAYWTAIFNYEARIQDVIRLVDDEEADRILADNALGGRIDDEIQDRIAADAALDDRIDDEIQDRIAADAALDDRIDDEIADRIAADNGEIADRIAADNGLQSQIDALANASNYKSSYKNIKDLGAVGDGLVHTLAEYYATLADAQVDYPFAVALTQTIDWAVMQKTINENDLIYVPSGTYMINSTITIPNNVSRMIVIVGDGPRHSVFNACNDSMTMISYARQAVPGLGCVLNFKDLAIITANTGVIGVSFKGQEVGGLRYEDNWIRGENLRIVGFYYAFDLAVCGNAYFNRIDIMNCTRAYNLRRAASFMHFYKNMVTGCGSFIYAEDPTPDGISNGIFVDDCEVVYNSAQPICIIGWQGVYITNSSCDIGLMASDQVALVQCSDFSIENCWIAGNHVAGQIGVRLWSTVNGCVTNCSIVNVDHGVRVDGLTTAINALTISDNTFDGCAKNDILALNSYGIVINANKMKDNIALYGTDADVYLTGCEHVVLMSNEFGCDAYSVNCGTNFVASANLFGVRI